MFSNFIKSPQKGQAFSSFIKSPQKGQAFSSFIKSPQKRQPYQKDKSNIYNRVYEGQGIETLFKLHKYGKKGDIVLSGKGTFWNYTKSNLKTGQTLKEIGQDLIRMGFDMYTKFGSEGRSISDMIELTPNAFATVSIYQAIFSTIISMAEMKGVRFVKPGVEIASYSKEGKIFKIHLTDGEIIRSREYLSNIGPGKERNLKAYAQIRDKESVVRFLSGEEAIQDRNWIDPVGDVLVVAVGPTSLWVVEHILLNLGYGYDEKGKWEWIGEGWKTKPQTKIKLLADPEHDSPEKIKELEKIPRLNSVLQAINKKQIPVEVVFGKTDISKLPKVGGDIECIDNYGKKSISNIGLVVSAAGQEFDSLYLSKDESYWLDSKIILGSYLSGPSNAGEQFRSIEGIQGPDKRKFGISTARAIAQSCLKYSQSSLLTKMAREILYNMDHRVYKNGPSGGISHLTKPTQWTE